MRNRVVSYGMGPSSLSMWFQAAGRRIPGLCPGWLLQDLLLRTNLHGLHEALYRDICPADT